MIGITKARQKVSFFNGLDQKEDNVFEYMQERIFARDNRIQIN